MTCDNLMTCKDCRFFREASIVGDAYCAFELSCDLPFWVKRVLENKIGKVKPEDGINCDTWEKKR